MIKPIINTLASVAIVVTTASVGLSNAEAGVPGYWTTKEGVIYRNSFGQCWKTRFWKPEHAIPECDQPNQVKEAKIDSDPDSDGDGVLDSADACPNTLEGTQVNGIGCEVDDDQDGVVDSKDQCPNTPVGTKVDAMGCSKGPVDSDGDGVVDSQDRCPNSPSGAVVNSSGCERDTDRDGVVDSKDQCPSSPVGAHVDARGCEPDGDSDGIVDSNDRCPNTAQGEKVDGQGCKLEEKIVLKGVNFETASDALTGGSSTALDEVAGTLARYPSMKVEVAGYTDNRGSTRYNQSLSQQRAEAVVRYLISKGVSSANLTAKGYGPSNPIADNNTTAGRAENRRVELHILEQ